jgi:hypothetical protein
MSQLPSNFVGHSLSHGTLRQEDIIPSFMSFLHHIKEQCDIVETVNNIQEEVDNLEFEDAPGYSGPYYKKPEDADFILNEDIFYLLNDIAPKFTYFGSSEGDGSDFGFWTNEESLLEHIQGELDSIVHDDFMNLDELNNELETLQNLLSDHL